MGKWRGVRGCRMTSFGPPSMPGMCAPVWKKKTRAPGKPLEKEIQKAIQQAFKLRHRIELKAMDAGGRGEVKGLVAVFPKWLRAALGLPQELPFGLEAWLHVPPGFSDLLGAFEGRWVFLEVKRPGQKPHADQLLFLEARRAEGNVAFWADSVESALEMFEQATARRTA